MSDDKAWTPRRRGAIYCSPRCGRGCTFAEYQSATRDAKALAKRLGAGWRTDVWENMGWHYRALSPCGRVKVSGERDSYLAFLGEPDSGGGRWAEHGPTPEDAIRAVVKAAVTDLNAIGAMIFDVGAEPQLAAPRWQRGSSSSDMPAPRLPLPIGKT